MVASRGLEWRSVLKELGRRVVEAEATEDDAYQWGILNFNTSIAMIDWRAAGLRKGRLPQTQTEQLIADKRARQAKLGADVMALVGAETVPSFRFKEDALIGAAANVVYDVAVTLAGMGQSFTQVVDELIVRNRKT
jgi:phosphoribosyl-ATP pyrophosphohydrolase